jgi:hypothetical protein
MSNLRLTFARVAGSVYDTLADTFATLRGKGNTRKLGYETFIVQYGDYILSLRHFGTDIVTVSRVNDVTERVTLNAAGYRSVTTANRMRMLFAAAGIPVTVYRKDGDYRLSLPHGTHEYRDGMSFLVTVSRDGYISVGDPHYAKRGW